MFVVVPQRGKYEIFRMFVEVRLDQEAGVGRSDIEIVRLGSQGLFEEFVCLVPIVQCSGEVGQTNLCC